MTEREFPGVEHLAGEIAGAFSAVEFIAQNRVTEMMKMNTNLVGAAAMDHAFNQAHVAAGAEDMIFGFR